MLSRYICAIDFKWLHLIKAFLSSSKDTVKYDSITIMGLVN